MSHKSEGLSKAEREITTMLAHGFMRGEIALIRHVSIQTVQTQITSARKRLSAKTTQQLVYRALKAGEID